MKTTTQTRAATMIADQLAKAEADLLVWCRNGIPTAQKEAEIAALRAAMG